MERNIIFSVILVTDLMPGDHKLQSIDLVGERGRARNLCTSRLCVTSTEAGGRFDRPISAARLAIEPVHIPYLRFVGARTLRRPCDRANGEQYAPRPVGKASERPFQEKKRSFRAGAAWAAGYLACLTPQPSWRFSRGQRHLLGD